MKTALILGSSGLTGSYVLKTLMNDNRYSKIILINRRPTSFHSNKVVEIISRLNAFEDLTSIDTIDTIFSCLGTTRKKTPDLNHYRHIEIDIPVSFAKAALSKGLKNFHYISAVGVKSSSKNFYLKIKSDAESALKELNIPALHIYQPSLIKGKRNDQRWGEGMAALIMPIIDKVLPKKYLAYHSIEAKSLAEGMVRIDNEPTNKPVTYHTYASIIGIL